MFKKALSYLFAQKIYQQNSSVNKQLDVVLSDGELLLNTPNANYSFGSLQRILEKGLTRIGKPQIQQMQSVLVLGVAGGSVIQSLYKKYDFTGSVTGVEIDPTVITLARDYFELDTYKKVTIEIQDAQQFISESVNPFDLIIIDVFIDTQMPSFLFESTFISNLKKTISPKGYMLFNTMVKTPNDQLRNDIYVSKFKTSQYQIQRLPLLERFNEVIIINQLGLSN